MVGVRLSRLRVSQGATLALGILSAFTLLSSCDAAKTLNPRTEEPILLLVLSDSASNPLQPQLTALLANSGRPSRLEYRLAQTFRMTRERDGAEFAWRTSPPPPRPGGAFFPSTGNYVLDERSSAAGLGREALRVGETYALEVVSEGRRIIGSARIPMNPTLKLESDGVVHRVVWQRIPGVERFLVFGPGLDAFVPITDTFVVLPRQPGTTSTVLVFALDSSYGQYLRDSTVFSAGLQGAYGVFGAVSASSIDVAAAGKMSAGALQTLPAGRSPEVTSSNRTRTTGARPE